MPAPRRRNLKTPCGEAWKLLHQATAFSALARHDKYSQPLDPLDAAPHQRKGSAKAPIHFFQLCSSNSADNPNNDHNYNDGSNYS
jgi:hypothetical protein